MESFVDRRRKQWFELIIMRIRVGQQPSWRCRRLDQEKEESGERDFRPLFKGESD